MSFGEKRSELGSCQSDFGGVNNLIAGSNRSLFNLLLHIAGIDRLYLVQERLHMG
jgi:hypothetical protein